MKTRSRGFTLLEVLISMSLFLVLGASLVALMTRAMDFLTTGAGGAEVQDKARDFLAPFLRDVRNVMVERRLEPGEPVERFLADRVPFDSDGDGTADLLAQRLTFVKSTNRESFDPKARNLALGGMEAVIWIAVPSRQVEMLRRAPKEGESVTTEVPEEEAEPQLPLPDPGLLTLYRGVQAPVGNALFDRKTVRSLEDLEKYADPLLSGVLHFGIEFQMARGEWTPFWDSTRSIPPGRYIEFPGFVGPESLADARDDVSPRAIRVTFAYERTGTEAEIGRLVNDIDDRARKVVVDRTGFATGSNAPYIKVGSEWMRYSGLIPSDGEITIMKRGERGTTAAAHEQGEAVRTGFTMTRTILIPSYREDWNSQ